MTYDEFVTLVRQMRAAQKRFFSQRGQRDQNLRESKQLEHAVDRVLAEDPRQDKLFPEGE
jgi:hypothetical protein